MSELIKERIKKSIGKRILLYLKSNNFRFEGKITNYDDLYFEILDFKTNSYKIFGYGEVGELEIKREEKDG